MKGLSLLRDHPLILAGVLFAAWFAYDATSTPPEVHNGGPESVPGGKRLAEPTVAVLEEPVFGTVARDPFKPGVVTQEQISRLTPGMARVEVEGVIGVPPAGLVHPVSNVDGRFVYRASYLANLDPRREASIPAPRSIIAIEFDASRPGHPLVKVHIPDPMS